MTSFARHLDALAIVLPVLASSYPLLRADEEKPKAEAKAPSPAIIQPARTLEGHEADVYQVRFSPDGTKLVTGSFDRTARIWEAATGKPLATLAGHSGKVLAVAFSSDGQWILTGSEDKTAKLWDAPDDGAARLAGHGGPVESIAVSLDGSWVITGAGDGTARLWASGSRKEALKLEGAAGPIRCVAFAADAKRVAAGGDDKIVRVYDVSAITVPPPPDTGAGKDIVKQGAPWRFLRGRAAPPGEWKNRGFDDSKWETGSSGFGYSPAPEELATVNTKLDDMANGGYLSLYVRSSFKIEDPKRVESLTLTVLSDDGFIAYLNGEEVGRSNVEGTPGFDGVAQKSVAEPISPVDLDLGPHVPKLVEGDNTLALQGHNQSAMSSDFVLTPVLKGKMKPMEKKEPAGAPEAVKLEGSGGSLLAIAFSADGARVAAGGDEKAVYIWELAGDGKPAKKLDQGGAVKALAFLGGSFLAAAGEGGAIRVWNAAEGKVERSLEGHQGGVLALAVHPDRPPSGGDGGGESAQLLSGGEDGSVRLWDAGAGKEVRGFKGHEGPVRAVAFAPDAKTFVSGGADKSLRVWSFDGKEVRKFTSPAEVRSVGAAAEESFFTAAGNDVLQWSASTTEPLKTFSGHGDLVHAVAFSPDGAMVASAGRDKTIRLWKRADGKEARSINAHEGTVYTIAYNHDGTLLASGGFDRVVKVWNTADGKEVKKLEGHGDGVFVVRFSGDGQFIFSGSSDRTIRKWNVADGKEAAVLNGHPGWVSGLAFFPGEKRMASIDFGGHVFTWNLAESKEDGHRKVPTVTFDLAVSPDGKWIATANLNSKVFIFPAE